MADVWDFGPGDASECNVLVCLANHCDDNGRSCFPSIARIASMSRLSQRTVIRVIAALETGGWIAVDRGAGRGVMSQYRIDVSKLKRCHDVTLLEHPEKVTLTTEKVILTTQKGDIDDKPPHPLIRVTVSEPSRNQIPPNPPQAGGGVKCVPITALCAKPERLDVEAAVESVMRECGFTARRLRLTIRAVVSQVIEREDGRTDTARQFEFPEEIAVAMIDAWQRYTKQGLRLKAHMNAAKFFGEGYWMNSNSWHWDNETIREERQSAQASVGSWR
jgi:DNA-binding transcriptional regulator YhcF (GntR family)